MHVGWILVALLSSLDVPYAVEIKKYLFFCFRETKDSVIFETVEEKLTYMGLSKKEKKEADPSE